MGKVQRIGAELVLAQFTALGFRVRGQKSFVLEALAGLQAYAMSRHPTWHLYFVSMMLTVSSWQHIT